LNDEPLYVMPVPAEVVATPIHAPFTNASVCPLDPVKSEVVEMVVGTAEPPVKFAQREFAAIAAKLIEELVPPTCEPSVPELVRPVPTETEEVPTD
jgi:hypothetical protein